VGAVRRLYRYDDLPRQRTGSADPLGQIVLKPDWILDRGGFDISIFAGGRLRQKVRTVESLSNGSGTSLPKLRRCNISVSNRMCC
jgi:hypothetical protein